MALVTRTDIGSGMMKNSAFAAVQVLWNTAVLFIVYRIATQHAGVSLLGMWSGAAAIAALAALADCGLTDLMVRQIAEARGRDDWARVVSLYRTLARFAATTVAVAAVALTPVIIVSLSSAATTEIKPELGWIVGAAALSVWLNTLVVGLFGVMEALGRYDLKFWSAFSSGLGMLATAVLILPRAPVIGMALTFSVGAAMNAAFAAVTNTFLLRAATISMRNAGKRVEKIAWRELFAMIKMGSQVRLAGIFLLGLEPVTRVLLIRFGGLDAVGLYELAYRAVFQLRSLIVAALQVLVPRLSTIRLQSPKQAISILSQATYQAVTLGLPAFALAVLCVPLLSLAMLSKLDWHLAQYTLLLAVAWSVNTVAAPGYFANLAEGKVRNNWLAHLTICIVNIAAGFALGAAFGASGVVIGTAIAIVAGSIVTLMSRRKEALKAHVSLKATDWAMLAGGAVAVVSIYFLWSSVPSTVLPLAVACFVAYGIAVSVKAAIGFFNRDKAPAFAAL